MLISLSPIILNFLMTMPANEPQLEEGIGHMIQRLYIHWDITTKCNFSCPYCYARKDYRDDWQKTDGWDHQKIVIAAIKAARLPVFVGLLGGEPTLHPRFTQIADSVLDACKNKNSRLYITTNGSVKRLRSVCYDPKIRILMSMHPGQEHKDPGFRAFFSNLDYMLAHGFKVRINLMLDPQCIARSLDLYCVLKDYPVELHPHFIYKSQLNDAALEAYDFNALKIIRDAPPEYTYNNTPVNDYEIFSKGLNKFKGWQCWNNNYEITRDGRVQNICTKREAKLSEDPMFFRRIREITPMICPYNECVCDGLLKIRKANNVVQHPLLDIPV